MSYSSIKFVFLAISDAQDMLLHQEQLPAELLEVSTLLRCHIREFLLLSYVSHMDFKN